MLTRLMTAGLLAGVLSGLAVAALQHVTTTPLILKAEVYERAAHAASSANAVSPARGHTAAGSSGELPSEDGEWAPADGLERTALTALATVGVGVGFALMLAAAMTGSGAPITPRSGAAWGLAAFAATGLAPGLGLPPELPGSAAADLAARQTWWFAAAAATAGGLWLFFRASGWLRPALGFALLAAPHLAGAPQPHEFSSTAPAELAARFVSASLAVHAVLWTLIGATLGLFWREPEAP